VASWPLRRRIEADQSADRGGDYFGEEGAHLLDVRYEDEYEMEYIPGCTLIPLLELRERVHELKKGTDYVVYCHSGRRSCVAAMILRQHKLHTVSLNGGIRDWPYEVEYPE
jgi:rhodanese-related sulfurtransferase